MRPPKDEARQEADRDVSPGGAILVTTFVALVILIFWFGVYLLNASRS